MAEAVSGVVTLTTFTLAIIRETAIFIRDAKEVDVQIQNLRNKLLDLQDWIELIELTCETARAHNELVPRYISESLSKCGETLKGVRDTIENLASRKSVTFYQKVKLKIRTENSKRDVLQAIEDVRHHESCIKSHMDIWHYQRTANIERRLSLQPAPLTNDATQATATNTLVPQRTWSNASNASTVLESASDNATSANVSPTTSPSSSSPDSARSKPLHSVPEQKEDTTSYTALDIKPAVPIQLTTFPLDISHKMSTDAQQDPVDLHHEISKYKNEDTRTQVIRQILERHPRSKVLANTKDECGRTPLCRAAQLGDVQLAGILVKFSADMNARDSQPCSVLEHALAQNHESFVGFLLEHGVDERGVSERYRGRLEEIKDTIELRRETLAKKKGKAKSRNSFTKQKGSGKSKNAFTTNTATRMVAT
jgi:hypothetical protein